MTEWQPIKSAPKDGLTRVLAWSPDDGQAIVFYEARRKRWSVVHDAEDYAWADYEPVAWQPLPSDPC